jgi:hypothetical protein
MAGDVFFFFLGGGGAADEGGGRCVWDEEAEAVGAGKWDEMSDLVRSCWGVRDVGGGEQ